eukprot:4527422-Pyramimonas_sp.AAC.1
MQRQHRKKQGPSQPSVGERLGHPDGHLQGCLVADVVVDRDHEELLLGACVLQFVDHLPVLAGRR